MKIILAKYNESLKSMLEEFCDTCKTLGYKNNSNFKSMRVEWCCKVGEFWCAISNEKIISVAGFHPLPEISSNAWRILFRGCQLPNSDRFNGLGKAHWNNIGFRDFIPVFIERCPSRELIITTNIYHDHSEGKSLRTHKAMQLMAKQNILKYRGDTILYNTYQSIWELNIDEYLNRRKKILNSYSSKIN